MTYYVISDFTGATLEEIDAYHLARGNALWTGTDTVKEQAMVRAWDYISSRNFQPEAFDSATLPDNVINAHAIASLEELTESGILQPVLDSENYIKKENLAGAIITEYKDSSPPSKIFSAINSLLSGYVYSSINIPTVRG